jgi:hypothetical protein
MMNMMMMMMMMMEVGRFMMKLLKVTPADVYVASRKTSAANR